MAFCLKDLEDRIEQEADNRRSIEQADLKVKRGLLFHWSFSKERHFAFSIDIQRPRELLLLRKRVHSLYSSQHIAIKRREEEESPEAWLSRPDQPNTSGRTMLEFFFCG